MFYYPARNTQKRLSVLIVNGTIAQLVEQRTHNSWVSGSNPGGPTKLGDTKMRKATLSELNVVRKMIKHHIDNITVLGSEMEEQVEIYKKKVDAEITAKL